MFTTAVRTAAVRTGTESRHGTQDAREYGDGRDAQGGREAVRTDARPDNGPDRAARHPEAPAAPAADPAPAWRDLGVDSMAAALVVSVTRLGARSFAARCQWPRWHPLNERALAVTHHPLLMVETTRQLAAAVRARHLGPVGGPLPEPAAISLGTDVRSRPTETGTATDVAARVTLSDLRTDAGAPAFRLTAEYAHAGTVFATCSLLFSPSTTTLAPSAPPAAPPGLLHPPAAAVGAAAEPDVLLARAAQGRLVIVPRDRAHPVLLPGAPAVLPAPAVLEAGRQAVLLSCGATAPAVAGLALRLHAPVPVRGAAVEVAAGRDCTRFVVLSGGTVLADGTVVLTRS